MVIKLIFVDTTAFYALEVEDDVNHEKARKFLLDEIRTGKYGIMITSNYIIDETLTLLRIRQGVDVALKFYDKVKGSKSIRIVWVNEGIFNEALEIFQRNDGKLRWSFTDCTSFAIMKALNIRFAFSFDRNFEEAGFVRLP